VAAHIAAIAAISLHRE